MSYPSSAHPRYARRAALLVLAIAATPIARVASARTRTPDRAARVSFTVDGGGHAHERVELRDADPAATAPYVRFYQDGAIFGAAEPLVELRAGTLGPKRWAIHLLLAHRAGAGPWPVTTAQPALIYNGDNTPAQQAWFPQIVLPPLRQGTLVATLQSGAPPGRARGTFAGTLVDDRGQEVVVSGGTFDLPRLPDVE